MSMQPRFCEVLASTDTYHSILLWQPYLSCSQCFEISIHRSKSKSKKRQTISRCSLRVEQASHTSTHKHMRDRGLNHACFSAEVHDQCAKVISQLTAAILIAQLCRALFHNLLANTVALVLSRVTHFSFRCLGIYVLNM